MIWVVLPGYGSLFFTHPGSRVQKTPGPGFRIRIRNTEGQADRRSSSGAKQSCGSAFICIRILEYLLKKHLKSSWISYQFAGYFTLIKFIFQERKSKATKYF